MSSEVKARFPLGQIVATPAALEALTVTAQSPAEFLDRHATGDWGDLCDGDRELNDRALIDGSRLLSAYVTRLGVRLWIITEAADEAGRRAATTILLPDDY
jgi:hypothetical protein